MYLVAPDRFENEEFVIRSYLPGDGAMLAEATNSSYEHLKPWLPWAKPQQSNAQAERYVRESRGRYLLAQDFTLGVFTLEEDLLLGGSGFHLREGGLEHMSAEVGLWIRQDRANKGLGTRVLGAVLRWGFDAWPWDRLAWHSASQNVASLSVASNAGMQSEGLLRSHRILPDGSREDTVCFAAIRDEWEDPVE